MCLDYDGTSALDCVAVLFHAEAKTFYLEGLYITMAAPTL